MGLTVHVSGSWYDQSQSRISMKTLTDMGYTIACDWTSEEHRTKPKNEQYHAIVKAIKDSDLCVFSLDGMEERVSSATFAQIYDCFIIHKPVVIYDPDKERSKTREPTEPLHPNMRNIMGKVPLVDQTFNEWYGGQIFWVTTPKEVFDSVKSIESMIKANVFSGKIYEAPTNVDGLHVHISGSWFEHAKTRVNIEALKERGHTIACDWTTQEHMKKKHLEQYKAIEKALYVSDVCIFSFEGMEERDSSATFAQLYQAIFLGKRVVVYDPDKDHYDSPNIKRDAVVPVHRNLRHLMGKIPFLYKEFNDRVFWVSTPEEMWTVLER